MMAKTNRQVKTEIGTINYIAWRMSCKLHSWQKGFEYGTTLGTLSERIEDGLGTLIWSVAGIISWVHKKAIKTAISGLVGALIMFFILTACGSGQSETYPRLMQVVDVNEETREVKLITSSGFTYKVVWDDLDVTVGEYYNCIMDDNGTRQIVDDTIVDIRYERPDLFPVYPVSFE